MPLSQAVEYAIDVIDSSERSRVFTTGQSQLLRQPEFQDLTKADGLMSLLTDQRRTCRCWTRTPRCRSSSARRTSARPCKDASVVVASYDIGDNMRGLIGVVGPTRMDYAAVAARLSYFAESLTKMFGKNNQLPPKEDDIP